MFDGLTTGKPSYDGIFILRNPENCNLIDYSFKEIPIYMEKKMKVNYNICMDFSESPRKVGITDIEEGTINHIKDFEVTSFIIDPSNFNTHIIRFKDKEGKTLVVCGDFKNYDGIYGREKLHGALSIISNSDVLVIEGKYLGKTGLEHSSDKDVLEKLRNIMKFYKQIFIIQSETDLNMSRTVYQAAIKSKKIFIESTFLCNLATVANGSCPTPFTEKKVYSYNPLVLENNDFEFKKKYVTPFYISSAINKMKKEKYVMNITKDMVQDIQVFEKEGSFYDACVIMAEWKGLIEQDEELEEFINILKNYDMDYYELYTHGQVNMNLLKEIIFKLKPKFVVPLDFSEEKNVKNELYNFRVLNQDEEFEI